MNTPHSEHCRIFLSMLTKAAEEDRAVPTYELAKVSRNHTARISNLRSLGHDIRSEDVPEAMRMPGEGRQTQYRYVGFTGKNLAEVMDVATNSLKPSFVRVTRIHDEQRESTLLRPEASGDGFLVTFEKPVTFHAGDQLLMESVHSANTDAHPRRLPLRIGGVMRCCIATLDDALVTENEGDTLDCRHCSSRLRVRDGAWEWDQEAYPKESLCT